MDPTLRKARVLNIIKALSTAGLTPVSLDRVYVFSYLASNIGTIWGFNPFETSFLKNKKQPYSPIVEDSIISFVHSGLVDIVDLVIHENLEGYEVSIDLNLKNADLILDTINDFPDEMEFNNFCIELAFAYQKVADASRSDLFKVDVTWDDPAIGDRRLISMDSFLEKIASNPTANVIELIQRYTPKQNLTTPEKLSLYVQLLIGRLGGGY